MLDDIDLDFLKSLSDLLEGIADAAVRLEKPDITILECDIIMETLVRKLKVVETDISSNFSEALISRYENRKNIMLVSLTRYLHNLDFFKNKNHTFIYASKKDNQVYAAKLFDQLFATKENSLQTKSDDRAKSKQKEPLQLISFFVEIQEVLYQNKPKKVKTFTDQLKEYEVNGVK